MYKNKITEKEFYDNTEESILLFKARTNALKCETGTDTQSAKFVEMEKKIWNIF